MTKVRFFGSGAQLTGFCLSGHASKNAEDENGRLVCAAVSSAAYMAANTLSEIIGAHLKTEEEDGYLQVLVLTKTEQCSPILQGFKLHMEQLEKQYKGSITVHSEV